MLASVLTGGAFCMFAVTALWLAGTPDEPQRGSIRQSTLQTSTLGDDLGSAPVDPPREPDVAPPEPMSPPLDRELAAGDEAEELERDLLLPPQPEQQPPTQQAPAQPQAVSDAGAPAPEPTPPPESDDEVAEDEDTDERARAAEPEPLSFEPCGMEVCSPGLVCCNASCGTCVAPGGTCSQLTCSMNVYPLSSFCGRNTCSVGEVCCNLSCGICAAPGQACSQRICD